MSPVEKDNNVKVNGEKRPRIDGKPQWLVFLNFLIERCANDF